MGCNNIKFISKNICRIKISEKRIEIFEYVKTRSILMARYSLKKRIPVKKIKKVE